MSPGPFPIFQYSMLKRWKWAWGLDQPTISRERTLDDVYIVHKNVSVYIIIVMKIFFYTPRWLRLLD